MILTNIIRASLAEPLAFVTWSSDRRQHTSATIGLPSIAFGPACHQGGQRPCKPRSVFGADAGTLGFTPNSGTISGSTTFNVTPSESKDFYLGLLTTVEPDTLAFFTQQGIARELLFYLFTDKIIEEKGGVVRQFRNDPLDPKFPEFQYYVALAMDYGLSSEQEPDGQAARPPNEERQGRRSRRFNAAAAAQLAALFRPRPGQAELPAADNTPIAARNKNSPTIGW